MMLFTYVHHLLAIILTVTTCSAEVTLGQKTRLVPGKLKGQLKNISPASSNPGQSTNGKTGINSLLTSTQAGERHIKSLGNTKSNSSVKDLAGRSVDLFGRQVTCPPGYPLLCPDLDCCPAATVCCNGPTCCAVGTPQCCQNTEYCCETGATCCPEGGCCDAGEACCDEFCCPSAYPVCGTTGCCPAGTSECGIIDPGVCHPAGTECCGDQSLCLEGSSCCGTDACCTPTVDEPNPKCCPAEEAGGESLCCGQYEVCCDGWCCFEGSTCSATFGQCVVPVLEWTYVPNTVDSALIKNACLGMRRQIANNIPNAYTNYQLVEYGGPGQNTANRKVNDCRSSRNPTCCANRVIPPGEPGAGNPTSCEEYPPASVVEGGPSAYCSCVNYGTNYDYGLGIGAMESGKHKGFVFWIEILGIDCSTVTEADLAAYACNPLA